HRHPPTRRTGPPFHHRGTTGCLGPARLPALARPAPTRRTRRRPNQPPRRPDRRHRLHHYQPRHRRLHHQPPWHLADHPRPHPAVGRRRNRLGRLATPPPTTTHPHRHHRPPR